MSITFHFKRSSRLDADVGRIFVRIIYQRQSGNMTLSHKIHPSEWNEQTRTVRTVVNDPSRISYLEKVSEDMEHIRQELQDLLTDAIEKEEEFTVTQILHRFRFNNREKGLCEWVRLLSNDLMENNCFRTARAYRTTLRSFLNFFGKKDILPVEITEKKILLYERFLKEKKLSLNTISFYMRNLRAICNKGVKQGIFSLSFDRVFSRVYTKVSVSRKKALTKEEMKKLENLLLHPSTPQDEKNALRLFMFSFHARGMSFVDLAYLKKSDIDLQAGKLSYFRRKTGQFIEVSINTALRQIIHYFMETNMISPFLFPMVRDQSEKGYAQYCTGLRLQNQRLKQIAAKAGLHRDLSTHQARHAWATIAKKENIPVWIISEGLGHSSVATTYIYLDSFGISVLDQAHRKVARAVSRIC